MKNVRIFGREIPGDLFIFMVISVLLGLVSAVESTSLANRLYDDLGFTIMQRTLAETPRELPGLLTVVIIGMLNSLGDVRIAAVANIVGGVGLLLFGMAPNQFSIVLICLVIYSTGQHLYIPLSNTIAMTFAKGKQFGQRLGQVQGLGSFAIIISTAVLYLLYKFTDITYTAVFAFAGTAMALAGVLFLFMDRGKPKVVSKKRFVFRREFKMYYLLQTVNGARKQITITFVPWLIIDIYGRPVTTITALFFVVCIINLFFKPWYGNLIDRKGEGFALQLEAVVMFIACIGFAFAKISLPAAAAMIVVGICYIGDKLMESAVMARATYVRKLARDPSEVARTLSTGQSMDHVVSMCIPVIAGWVWYSHGANGYIYVFLGALAVSVINYILASVIRKKERNKI